MKRSVGDELEIDDAWKNGPWDDDGDGKTVSGSTTDDQGTTTTTGEPRLDVLADADTDTPDATNTTKTKSGPELAAISRIDIALDSTPDYSPDAVAAVSGQTSITAWANSPLLALKHDLRSDAQTIRSMSDSPETERFAEHVLATLAEYPDRPLKAEEGWVDR